MQEIGTIRAALAAARTEGDATLTSTLEFRLAAALMAVEAAVLGRVLRKYFPTKAMQEQLP